MVTRPFKEAETSTLSFEAEGGSDGGGYSRSVLEAFVQFCYKGGPPARLKSTHLPELLHFALTYGVTRLVTVL